MFGKEIFIWFTVRVFLNVCVCVCLCVSPLVLMVGRWNLDLGFDSIYS